jgi:hypothetical protein
MNRILILGIILLTGTFQVSAQSKWFTKKGQISFYSETAVEKIEAHNKRVTAVLEQESGKLEFSVLITAFEFEKALMQEHFNENYMESSKFPKSTFIGKITNPTAVNYTKDGEYSVQVEGDLTMHGVTKKITEKASIIVNKGKISAKTTIQVALKDYNITVPSVVGAKIAEVIRVEIFIPQFDPLKK